VIGVPSTTLTVYRQARSTDPDHAGMLDPWDEDERAALSSSGIVAFGVPARIASPAPTGTLEPSARQGNVPLAVVNPGTDIRLGDEVVDDRTGARYRITDVTERQSFSGALDHRRLGLSRVSLSASDTVGT
jgi:hypothetical protein